MSTQQHSEQRPKRSSHVLASLVQAGTVVGILAVGVVGSRMLSAAKQPPPRVERTRSAPLVESLPIEAGSIRVEVSAQGTVQAKTEVRLASEVGGRVLWVHPELRAGGRFAAGEALLRIDPTDLQLAVAVANADVAAAETQVSNQQAEAQAAIAEWDDLHPGEPAPALVSRAPQIAEARARLESARARVRDAQLDLARCEVRLPFAGCVSSAQVSAGDLVSPGSPLAEVYDATSFEIPVPVEDHELALLEVPGLGAARGAGSHAAVSVQLAGRERHLEGQVVRMEGRLDPRTRLARLVVEVKAPEEGGENQSPSLIPGAFARVTLAGEALEDVVRVKRQHVHEDGVVWVAQEGRLVFVEPELVYSGDDVLYLRGLPEGARLITSPLEVVTDGMSIRLVEEPR